MLFSRLNLFSILCFSTVFLLLDVFLDEVSRFVPGAFCAGFLKSDLWFSFFSRKYGPFKALRERIILILLIYNNEVN